MSWNYRIMKRAESYDDEFVLSEVFYNDDNIIDGWGMGNDGKGEAPYGETLEELRNNLEMMLEAFDKPFLMEAELLAEVEAKMKEEYTHPVRCYINDDPSFPNHICRDDLEILIEELEYAFPGTKDRIERALEQRESRRKKDDD